ncbi:MULTISPECIES: hypothetical protein [unclassified Serratia (in: enterobacteria)]|uniref:hypothetical protein n=1 Tax=unclassified Serratia (in: enterobacteria) TaxID=2647522 RepID=UPI0030764870
MSAPQTSTKYDESSNIKKHQGIGIITMLIKKTIGVSVALLPFISRPKTLTSTFIKNTKQINNVPLRLALPCLVLLTGCDGDINTVKKQVYPQIDASMTIGQALETRKDCENGSWDSYKDDRGRKIIQYTCNLPQRYLDMFKNSVSTKYNLAKDNEKLQQDIAILESRKNDVPTLLSYIKLNYSDFKNLDTVDNTTFSEALNTFSNLSTWSETTLTVPSKEDVCRNRTSCEPYYSTVVSIFTMFNNFYQQIGYNKSWSYPWSYHLVPLPSDSDIRDIVGDGYSVKKTEITRIFSNLVLQLSPHDNQYYPHLSFDDITAHYSALIPKINTLLDEDISKRKNKFDTWAQKVNQSIDDANYSSVTEKFYWYLDNNDFPAENGGTLTFTKNGKSESYLMKNSSHYLSVAYQNIALDEIPKIYMSAMGTHYYNTWLITSGGGI